MSRRSTPRRARGVTLIEATLAAAVMGLVIFGGLLTLLATITGWTRGQAKIDVEVTSDQALRFVVKQLREATFVSVDGDGRGLTYQLPAKDGTGAYVVPAVSDGVNRRLQINSSSDLVWTDGTSARVILRKIVLEDPRGNSAPVAYQPFRAGAGAVTRQVTVHLVTKRLLAREGKAAWGRLREVVALRNVPPGS